MLRAFTCMYAFVLPLSTVYEASLVTKAFFSTLSLVSRPSSLHRSDCNLAAPATLLLVLRSQLKKNQLPRLISDPLPLCRQKRGLTGHGCGVDPQTPAYPWGANELLSWGVEFMAAAVGEGERGRARGEEAGAWGSEFDRPQRRHRQRRVPVSPTVVVSLDLYYAVTCQYPPDPSASCRHPFSDFPGACIPYRQQSKPSILWRVGIP
ncbi:hypothetical protein B0T26DRAFT_288014 [Lasiosphaeria miniovina]|uniref:Uncharacterized protein n=1 Tax=Lasiosphaeria miniovina TaxID=1954250 RepID=A0AA40AK13_9PEZI|nr:uncharacterized protein B0T26DRAFT_288014 [Lasiosphaeria miniovina]KAK0717195.1 hypothetical protein B0T26DRAFT_288014 [Lasiosphaeria miniovina]